MQQFHTSVLPGDLVFNSENQVAIVEEGAEKQYSIHDVILPLCG